VTQVKSDVDFLSIDSGRYVRVCPKALVRTGYVTPGQRMPPICSKESGTIMVILYDERDAATMYDAVWCLAALYILCRSQEGLVAMLF
jgi:hypothetical protein